MSYVWPILLVICANVLYNICTKSMPKGVNPFASLAVTYLVASACAGLLYFITGSNKNMIAELKSFNWTTYFLGLSIVGLEIGYIQVYRVGWNISVGSLVANIGLAIMLILVGLLLYREHVSGNQILGILICVIGLIVINKK